MGRSTDDTIHDGLMTAHEACDFFRIGRTTLYDWTHRGLLQSLRIRGSRRWLRQSVFDLAARGAADSPTRDAAARSDVIEEMEPGR